MKIIIFMLTSISLLAQQPYLQSNMNMPPMDMSQFSMDQLPPIQNDQGASRLPNINLSKLNVDESSAPLNQCAFNVEAQTPEVIQALDNAKAALRYLNDVDKACSVNSIDQQEFQRSMTIYQEIMGQGNIQNSFSNQIQANCFNYETVLAQEYANVLSSINSNMQINASNYQTCSSQMLPTFPQDDLGDMSFAPAMEDEAKKDCALIVFSELKKQKSRLCKADKKIKKYTELEKTKTETVQKLTSFYDEVLNKMRNPDCAGKMGQEQISELLLGAVRFIGASASIGAAGSLGGVAVAGLSQLIGSVVNYFNSTPDFMGYLQQKKQYQKLACVWQSLEKTYYNCEARSLDPIQRYQERNMNLLGDCNKETKESLETISPLLSQSADRLINYFTVDPKLLKNNPINFEQAAFDLLDQISKKASVLDGKKMNVQEYFEKITRDLNSQSKKEQENSINEYAKIYGVHKRAAQLEIKYFKNKLIGLNKLFRSLEEFADSDDFNKEGMAKAAKEYKQDFGTMPSEDLPKILMALPILLVANDFESASQAEQLMSMLSELPTIQWIEGESLGDIATTMKGITPGLKNMYEQRLKSLFEGNEELGTGIEKDIKAFNLKGLKGIERERRLKQLFNTKIKPLFRNCYMLNQLENLKDEDGSLLTNIGSEFSSEFMEACQMFMCNDNIPIFPKGQQKVECDSGNNVSLCGTNYQKFVCNKERDFPNKQSAIEAEWLLTGKICGNTIDQAVGNSKTLSSCMKKTDQKRCSQKRLPKHLSNLIRIN